MEENRIIKLKDEVCDAGEIAAKELIKIAKEPIIEDAEDLSADKLTNAAKAKKIAIMDAFEILDKVQEQRALIEKELEPEKKPVPKDWTATKASEK